MAHIKLQNHVPEIYPRQSRDFQLLLRITELLVNSGMYDISCMRDITNTMKIRSNLLPLLQTKVGFFSNKAFNSDELRYILYAFPYIVKCKGSRKSIELVVNAWLKAKHETDARCEIQIVGAEGGDIGGVHFDAHTIVVIMNVKTSDTSILDELFKYILPAGYSYEFIFYEELSGEEILDEFSNLDMIIADDLNKNNTIIYNSSVENMTERSTSGVIYDTENHAGIKARMANTVNTVEAVNMENGSNE